MNTHTPTSITALTHNIYPIMAGDMAPPFFGIDQQGKDCVLLGFAGKPVVLFFYPHIATPGCEQLLQNFATYHDSFTQAGIELIAIGLDSQEVTQNSALSLHITYPMLSVDSLIGSNAKGLHLLSQYGVVHPNRKEPGKINFTPCCFIIDYNSRIREIAPVNHSALYPRNILHSAQTLVPPREVREMHSQAPVLFIDNVLTKAECDHLIHIWHTQDTVDSGSMLTIEGKTVGVYDYNRKIRRDHFIADPALLMHLDIIMRRRIFPQIKKAFHFECTRREEYKIACYDAERGGYFRKHRDNTTAATAHRIWAMSLNLNSEDYEGGHVKFPEFSDYLYKPTTGSALIFSGSMMHEATDVRNGKRFVLLQFFYGDKEGEVRDKNRHLLVENNDTPTATKS